MTLLYIYNIIITNLYCWVMGPNKKRVTPPNEWVSQGRKGDILLKVLIKSSTIAIQGTGVYETFLKLGHFFPYILFLCGTEHLYACTYFTYR